MEQNYISPDKKIKEVALRIKSTRESLGFSKEKIAELINISADEYSAYEDGVSDFSFSFIYKFANICRVEIVDLMDGQSPSLQAYTVTRKNEGTPIARRAGFAYNQLAPKFKNKIAEPFLVNIPYSDEASKTPHFSSHKGQEFNIVVKGSMRIRIGDNIEILNEGDTIYYDSSTPHDVSAYGGEDCSIYAIVINPTSTAYVQPVKPMTDMPHITNFELANIKDPVSDKFVKVSTDEKGLLTDIKFINEENFNFSFDVVDALAEKCPDKTALIYLSNELEERKFTFAEIKKYSCMTANYFRSLGIKKGDKVMLVLKRHYQFWFSILALHRLGAIAIPATNQLVEHDFSYRFESANVSAIVCTGDGDVARQAELSIEKINIPMLKIMAHGTRDGWHNFDDEIEKFSDSFPRPADTSESAFGSETMLMYFTSGTTGYPKIASHSHKYPLGHFLTARYWHNVDPNGVHFTISDTGWGKALWGKLYGQWLSETAIFVYDFERFDSNKILPLFAKYNITTFCAPPTMYRFFIKEDLSKFDLSSIKYATVAGEALNPEVFNQFYNATGVKLMEGFGQTETTVIVGNFIGTDPKPGSMGKPSVLFDADIVNPDGSSCSTGETGEIVIKTDKSIPCGLFQYYYNSEDLTNEAWHDGVYHTGDTAWRDEDDYFWYVGRLDDLIKSSGYRIGPFEIESVIMELPYVLECAVTPVPDEVRGQIVKATVVLTKDTAPSEDIKKEIQAYVKKNTAPYKYPRIVEFRDELPKTISGKIRRVELK